MKLTSSIAALFTQLETLLTEKVGKNKFRLNLNACTADKTEIRFVYWNKDTQVHNEIVFNRETETFSNPSFWAEGQI